MREDIGMFIGWAEVLLTKVKDSELKWTEAILSVWELILNIWDGFTSSEDCIKHIETCELRQMVF